MMRFNPLCGPKDFAVEKAKAEAKARYVVDKVFETRDIPEATGELLEWVDETGTIHQYYDRLRFPVSLNLASTGCMAPSSVAHRLRGQEAWQYTPMACGECPKCKERMIRHETALMMFEAEDADHVAFITLTFAPPSDPETEFQEMAEWKAKASTPYEVEYVERYFAERRARRYDRQTEYLFPPLVRDFIRNLRKQGVRQGEDHPGEGFTFAAWVAGEYGGEKNRPHYHLFIVFRGARPRAWMEPHFKRNPATQHILQWPHGHMDVQWDVGEEKARYVAKYLVKAWGVKRNWQGPVPTMSNALRRKFVAVLYERGEDAARKFLGSWDWPEGTDPRGVRIPAGRVFTPAQIDRLIASADLVGEELRRDGYAPDGYFARPRGAADRAMRRIAQQHAKVGLFTSDFRFACSGLRDQSDVYDRHGKRVRRGRRVTMSGRRRRIYIEEWGAAKGLTFEDVRAIAVKQRGPFMAETFAKVEKFYRDRELRSLSPDVVNAQAEAAVENLERFRLTEQEAEGMVFGRDFHNWSDDLDGGAERDRLLLDRLTAHLRGIASGEVQPGPLPPSPPSPAELERRARFAAWVDAAKSGDFVYRDDGWHWVGQGQPPPPA